MSHTGGDHAWRATATAVSLFLAGEVVTVLVDLRIVGGTALVPVRMAHASLCALALVVLVARRRTASPTFLRAIFWLCFLPLLVVFPLAHAARTHVGLRWGFIGHWIGMFLAAALAPPPALLAFVAIAALAAEVVVHTALLGPDVSPVEPWMTLLIGAMATVVLVERFRHLRVERELALARTLAESRDRWQRAALAINDLANTPLQTLALCTALLRQEHPDVVHLVERMERALGSLRELRKLLDRTGPESPASREDLSIDSVDVLTRRGSPRASPPRRRAPRKPPSGSASREP